MFTSVVEQTDEAEGDGDDEEVLETRKLGSRTEKFEASTEELDSAIEELMIELDSTTEALAEIELDKGDSDEVAVIELDIVTNNDIEKLIIGLDSCKDDSITYELRTRLDEAHGDCDIEIEIELLLAELDNSEDDSITDELTIRLEAAKGDCDTEAETDLDCSVKDAFVDDPKLELDDPVEDTTPDWLLERSIH